MVSALHHKLWRDLRALRGQVIAIGLVMVGGIGTMTMAQSNYTALAGTRALYYAEYRFADVFALASSQFLGLMIAATTVFGVACYYGLGARADDELHAIAVYRWRQP